MNTERTNPNPIVASQPRERVDPARVLARWCEWVRRGMPVKTRPDSTSPYVGGLRQPRSQDELNAILDSDARIDEDWVKAMVQEHMEALLREWPDIAHIRAVDEALEELTVRGKSPVLLRRYILHRRGDGLPAESFHGLAYPPDSAMPKTLREMGWSVPEFLESSLARLERRIEEIIAGGAVKEPHACSIEGMGQIEKRASENLGRSLPFSALDEASRVGSAEEKE